MYNYYNNYLSSWSDIKTMIYSLENVYQGYLYKKTDEGVNIYIEIALVYGFNIVTSLQSFKKKC